jgi:predicted nucleic acid-binding protein
LRRIATNEIEGILPQPAWQELMHKLMLAEALQAGMISGGNPARQLATKPASVRRLSQYKDKVRVLVEMGLGFEPCTRKDLFEEAPRLQERYGFLTNDSVLLAVAIRLKADVLVTADAAFKPVTEITICTPSDLR